MAGWEAVVSAVGDLPGVEGARAFAHECLKVDGKVFAVERPDGLGLKLPAERVQALKAAGDGADFGSGGRVMREWVTVRPSAAASWPQLAAEALALVRPPAA